MFCELGGSEGLKNKEKGDFKLKKSAQNEQNLVPDT